MKKLMVFASILIAASVHAEPMSATNNPDVFEVIAGGKLTKNFAALPTSAMLKDDRIGWSETYWPSKLGGIAYRWNSPNPKPFRFKKFKKAELMTMSQAQLSLLSPAELYDISQGDYSYTLTKKVLSRYSKRNLWWEGICHGWAQAASNYPEPDKTVIVNPDGIRVPFGASDVKGLISMHDAFNKRGKYAKIGVRCNVKGKVPGEELPSDGPTFFPTPGLANRPDCTDVNPGAFHIVLSNMIGIYSKGFVADIDRFADIWNQPVVGYKTQAFEAVALNAADVKNGVAKKVRMVTEMSYGDELEFHSKKAEAEGSLNFVSKEPVTGTPNNLITTRVYEYVLEMNAANEIVGGTWISLSRPDFMWMRTREPGFINGKYPLAGLINIYKPVQR